MNKSIQCPWCKEVIADGKLAGKYERDCPVCEMPVHAEPFQVLTAGTLFLTVDGSLWAKTAHGRESPEKGAHLPNAQCLESSSKELKQGTRYSFSNQVVYPKL